MNRHCALHAPRAELTLATALSSIVATVVPAQPHARLSPSAPRPPSPTHALTLARNLAHALAKTLAPILAPSPAPSPSPSPSPCAPQVALYLPCYDSGDPHGFWACTPPVWRTPAFLALALADAVSK